MAKYKFIYCNRCKDFYLNWTVDFGNMCVHCPAISCMTSDVKVFEVDTMAEMTQIERNYKIQKITKNVR